MIEIIRRDGCACNALFYFSFILFRCLFSCHDILRTVNARDSSTHMYLDIADAHDVFIERGHPICRDNNNIVIQL
jgi:hypothetical protein